ncbi:MAG: ATP-binding cassette domain-containing protein, partial [bacterium]|nr:ATP-binding cassette domain-containing protein [bacterium]
MVDGQAAIEIRDVSKVFDAESGRVVALEEVSLRVAPGEFVSVIGPSGCGKTSLMRLVGDLEQATSGQVLVNGRPPVQARQS